MLSAMMANSPRIKQLMMQHGGFLPVQNVQSLLSEFDLTLDQLLLELVLLLKEFSFMPVSHYRVGAVAVGETGNLYCGANIELDSLPLNLAVHAEQSAIVMAHVHGETVITKVASSEKPCGHCRQFFYELTGAAELEVLLPNGEVTKLKHLLPHAFGAKDLGVEIDLLADKQLNLQLKTATQEPLITTALRAANHSYSPYAKSYAGVALRTQDGKIYHGSYLENAAFNPSVPALQAAFVHLIQSGAQFNEVVDAVLVQVDSGAVNHCAMTEMTLQAICPKANLQVEIACAEQA
jgi:cytidine deaminase